MFVVGTDQEAKDKKDWHFGWGIVGKGSGASYEEVEEYTERQAYDDAGNGLVDGEEVVGKGITKEEQVSSKRKGQTFNIEIEVPDNLRCRCRLWSIMDPRIPIRAQRSSNCLPNMSMNAVRREATELEYGMAYT